MTFGKAALFLTSLAVIGPLGSPAAQAGPLAVRQQIPPRFFGERTIVVAHVNLAGLSSARVTATLRAIVPAKLAPALDSPSSMEQLAAIDVFTAPLRAVGASHVTVVAIAGGGEDFADVGVFVLVPLDPEASAELRQQQLAALGGLAQSAGRRVEPLGTWAVLHDGTGLPENSDETSVHDASFFDALAKNPDRDVAVAFVPTEAMRRAYRANRAEARAEEDDDGKRIVDDLEPLGDGEWYYASTRFGADPELRLGTNLPEDARAASASSRYNALLDWGKGQVREKMAEDKREAEESARRRGERVDPEDYDPEPIVNLLESIKSKPDDSRVVVRMDRADLKTAVEGIVAVVESIGTAIGGIFGD